MATADKTTGKKNGNKKLTAFGFSAPVGGFTVAAGWHSVNNEMDDAKDTKDKRTQFNVRGPLGDTGMSFSVNFADVDTAGKNKQIQPTGSNPWNIHVAKSLGGGASVALEHIDHDHNKELEEPTKIMQRARRFLQLRVDF